MELGPALNKIRALLLFVNTFSREDTAECQSSDDLRDGHVLLQALHVLAPDQFPIDALDHNNSGGNILPWKDAAGNWTFLTITARASTTSVTATIDGPDASATTATVSWRLGVWSTTTGFPGAVTFHQNRLVFGGPTDTPQRIDMSRTGDFENFAPTEEDGTVVDDNAVTDNLSGDTVNNIEWN